jgi:hypothetical protein
MGAYRKFSDTWRRENAPETLGGLDALGGVDGRFAVEGQPAEAAPKAPKIEALAGANAGYAPPKPPKAPKVLQYQQTFGLLQLSPPAHIPEDRWTQCIKDGRAFLHQWGEQAQALNWSSADLFGLHRPPATPHPSYRRLSRYDCTGLVWLLEGREVVALTDAIASIRNPVSGSITVYRKHNKPAYGPLGDSLDDGWPR